jgi:hypothetical protein
MHTLRKSSAVSAPYSVTTLCPEMQRRQGTEEVQRSKKPLNEAAEVKIAYSYNISLNLSHRTDEREHEDGR